jgi:hypothetical protein
MTTIPIANVLSIIRELFTEAFEGAQGPATWFVNHQPNCGIFGTIDSLDADAASRTVTENGRSVAAHAEHLRWWLANVNTVARGGQWNPDWSGSWSVQSVNESEWTTLRAALRTEYQLVLESLDDVAVTPDDRMMLTGMMAMPAHAAHHLGAMRQMVKRLGR